MQKATKNIISRSRNFLFSNGLIILMIVVSAFAVSCQQQLYTVTYNGNGATSGTAPVDSNQYVSNATVTVLENTGNLEKKSYVFSGWNTKADGNGTTYSVGETFTITGNTTLYAKWEIESKVEKRCVGGTIFYIDNTATGATYSFYDEEGNNITRSVKVGSSPYYYSVSGTPSKDKFYVAEKKSVVKASASGVSGVVRKYDKVADGIWSLDINYTFNPNNIDVFGDVAGAEGSAIGTGRRNTDYITKQFSTDAAKKALYFPSHNGNGRRVSCWDFAKYCNENKTNGCDDWFVPSIAECKALKNSGIWGSSSAEWVATTEYKKSGYSYLLSSSAYSDERFSWHWEVAGWQENSYPDYGYRDHNSDCNFLALIRAF